MTTGATVTETRSTEAKQRIFETATRLFARQGFGATGVRQIAKEAEVNLAMINYFYGSKAGLLKAILGEFYDGLIALLEAVVYQERPSEERLRQFIWRVTGYFRANADAAIIALTEIPKDTTEIVDFKAGKLQKLFPLVGQKVLAPLAEKYGRTLPLPVIGPMMTFAIASHFIIKPMIERLGLIELDEDFYRTYPDYVANIALFGLTGVKKWRFAEQSTTDHDAGESDG